MKFVATKRYDNKFFFHPSLLLKLLDPVSGMGKKIRIRDKDPESATLVRRDKGLPCRMILIRSGRETSVVYEPCYAGQAVVR